MTKRNIGSLQYKSFGLALQALVVLAKDGGTCPSCEIAKMMSYEPTLLRRILAKLAKESILVTREGRDGGYALNKAPDQLTLAEVYRALEVGEARHEAVSGTMCVSDFGTQMKTACCGILEEVDRSVTEVLKNYTVADVVRKAGY
ncbi:RrF2 family transcriptional regulator [Paenibacillus rhizophilus]|uniref:Rrf2 family transcriptional regulator n=1 Tax=Paenibacillus rhizophilus TaxID=1850366 RepID=A0A3N9PXC2_9BACL|nr:Rrf2 family transcriptional regulator [Paenibacillus rhizophilus]RQW09846.1 Rrf2 family transcriptional regulator [Paenibacillus rhizophilus]